MEEGIGKVTEQVERLAKQSFLPKITTEVPGRKGTYALLKPDSEGKPSYEIKTAVPEWHNELLLTPETLIDFVTTQSKDTSAGVIYLNQEKMVYVYDFDDRRDKATCQLIPSEQIQFLLNLKKTGTTALKQTEILKVLRIKFKDCLPAGSLVIDHLRSVKWGVQAEGGAVINRGKESMGREITASVKGLDLLPEEIRLRFPYYENVKTSVVEVNCALEINVADESFSIIPFPQELQKAQTVALESIEAMVKGTHGAPKLFYGSSE